MSAPSTTAYVLRGVRPYGTDPVDVVLADGVIAAVGAPGTVEVPGDATEIQADGQVLLPGQCAGVR